MKMKQEKAYKLVLWTAIAVTAVCYFWTIYSLVRWIVGLF